MIRSKLCIGLDFTVFPHNTLEKLHISQLLVHCFSELRIRVIHVNTNPSFILLCFVVFIISQHDFNYNGAIILFRAKEKTLPGSIIVRVQQPFDVATDTTGAADTV
jgi:hypothetical protein